MRRFGLAFVLVLLGPAMASAQDEVGRQAFARYGCANCHEVELSAPAGRQSCVGCHQRVVGARRSGLGRAPHVEHFVHVPALQSAARRLRADYLVAYLQDPHDVRPRLEETMPRLPVTEEDARSIVAFLRSSAGEVEVSPSLTPTPANVTRGEEVFRAAGCAVCHEFGNRDFGFELPPEALGGLARPALEAPNLRFVRERMDPDVALAWLLDPASVDPDTLMPKPGLSPEDALALRDFLYLGDPGQPAVLPSLPSSEAPSTPSRVRYADVRPVFQSSCIHCHAHTDGRAASAFGFEPSSLDLSSAAGVRAGVLLPDGSRRSILEPDETGTAPLIRRLLRRHEEAARDVVAPRADPMLPALRARPEAASGMPLGLPPIGRDDLRLLASWVAAGAPD